MSFSEDLEIFSEIVKCEFRGKSRKDMLFLHKKIFELALRASEEDYPRYSDVTPKLHNTVLDALTLAELILHENDPRLRNPETRQSFGEIIGLLEPTEFDINFDEDFDSRVGPKRKWIFSYLWEMHFALDGWLTYY
jgi:hypothetical protein